MNGAQDQEEIGDLGGVRNDNPAADLRRNLERTLGSEPFEGIHHGLPARMKRSDDVFDAQFRPGGERSVEKHALGIFVRVFG